MTRVALVQKPPVYYDMQASLSRMAELLAQATSSAEGCDIVAFGESWLCGYPCWIDHYPDLNRWDDPRMKSLWRKHHDSALVIGSNHADRLSQIIRDHGVYVLLGCNERVLSGPGHGGVYNSLLTIAPDGSIINHHRKLVPTYTEKLLYQQGDAAGLQAHPTPHGRIGSMICWEHWMPLARQTMHDAAEDLHFAVWPMIVKRHELATQHYAHEGRCYVLSIGQYVTAGDMPDILAGILPDDHVLLSGGSCVAGPDGEWLYRPDYSALDIVHVELPSLDRLTEERLTLAVSGHYQRPDIFTLSTSRSRL